MNDVCGICDQDIWLRYSDKTWLDHDEMSNKCHTGEWAPHAWANRPTHKPTEDVTDAEVRELFGLDKAAS